jgi:hypothetical protein
MPCSAPRHDRDAGGPAGVLAAKAALRQEVWPWPAGGICYDLTEEKIAAIPLLSSQRAGQV